MTTELVRLVVRCMPEDAEPVLASLLDLSPAGVEEREADDMVEYAIVGAPGELPDLGSMAARSGDRPLEVRSEPVEPGWEDRWRDFHRPVTVAGRIRVRPPWAEPDDAAGDRDPAGRDLLDVVIDPGRAFGTGSHPTTRLCLELLLEVADRRDPGPLADWGCGSGVLAVAGAMLGFAPVRACDSEAAAVEATLRAARDNGVEVDVERCDLRVGDPPTAPVVVANLIGPLLRGLASRMSGAEGPPLRAPEVFVCSGLLDEEADDISARLAAVGLREARRRTEGDWAAILAIG